MRQLTSLFIFLLLVFSSANFTLALECEGDPPKNEPEKIQEYIKNCNQKIDALRGEQQTLKATIAILNSKINLAQAQIANTIAKIQSLEKDIATLSTVITDLDLNLKQLTAVYQARIQQSYKKRTPDSLILFFSSDSFSKFLTRLRYINVAKAKDKLVINELSASRNSFDLQKKEKHQKQEEMAKLQRQLVSQKNDLATKQQSKQSLLVATQNNEKKYQELLSQAKAELEAIEAVIAGKGSETQIRQVKQGEVIAKVIEGPSCNSSGSHLHFIVSQKSLSQNPFNYLKSVDHVNCSGSACGSSDSDPFNPSGSWEWPIRPPISFYQGYGRTWAVANTWVGNIYDFHNGIDIESASDEVIAVTDGNLYRGSYTGSGGCTLKYVRIDHQDSDLDTFYLHVNYF
ncbi:hypothetical protein HY333_00195 [Candidatus Collierbacteria bacterium]|nr:hypothetical protein [Candidatus Collierbacteria bacterium]